MKAIRVHEAGPPSVLVLEDISEPVPRADEVLVRIHAVGINPVDTYIRSGKYAHLPPYPYIPGADAAGTIVALGSGVSTSRLGDRVYLVSNGLGFGAYAEFIAWPAHSLARIPDCISFTQAAAINIPYATAHRALHLKGSVEGGETVLIHGGSGGVGIAAIQIGVAAGARVFATAGSRRGMELTLANGASHCFNHNEANYVEAIRHHIPEGFALIIENLANLNLDIDLGLIATFGRIVVVGSRGRLEIDPRRILQTDATVCGMALWNATDRELQRVHASLYAGLSNGSLCPVIGRELPLAKAATAHELVMESGAYGKIVLLPGAADRENPRA